MGKYWEYDNVYHVYIMGKCWEYDVYIMYIPLGI